MKVTGREKDYYDSALDYSAQEQQEWFRDIKIYNIDFMEESEFKDLFVKLKKKIKFDSISFSNINKLGFNNHYQDYVGGFCLSSGFISFSGKIYPFIKLTDNLKILEVFYNYDSLFRFLEANDCLSILDKERVISLFDRFRLGIKKGEAVGKWIESYLGRVDFPDTSEFHVSLNTPVIIFDQSISTRLYSESHFAYDNKFKSSASTEGFVLLSGRLSDYQFIKVLDPYLFVQELEMFMGNFLVKRDPEPEFTDKDKIQSHGFDDKISFRKEKTKK